MKLKIEGKVREVRLNMNRDFNRLVQKHTAFGSWGELIHAAGGYRPSIYLGGKTAQAQRELLALTVEYNSVQQGRGDSRRVYQGDFVAVHPNRTWLRQT